ncbi:MAG: SAM-dependent methyltransferase [Solirubrobacterales bacterium]|nr:SAM-dependent methyltransferase [Solirubrobacterales bacterium]
MTVEKFTALTPELHRYLIEHNSWRRDAVSKLIEKAAEGMERPEMQISPDQAAFMTVLVRASGASRALELGTFLGYGSIAIGRGLPEDGSLLSCEIDESNAERAREYIEQAGLTRRVEVRVGPALETLQSLPAEEAFDLSFIDADKVNYPSYYEEVLTRTVRGGLVLIDNTFMGGSVLEPDGDSSRAVAELNELVAADDRVQSAMVGVADGITLALKR